MESKVIEFMRAVARPAISIIFTLALAWAVLNQILLPEWFLALAIPAITWWFAERAITHAKANNSASVEQIAGKLAKLIKEK